MLKEFYPSKERIESFKQPPSVSSWTSQYKPPVGVTSHDVLMASKLGISVDVYKQRCVAVEQASNESGWMIGDLGMPSLKKDEKTGMCRVVGICRHYDNYGDFKWNDPPFILSVQPLNAKNNTIQCTAGWLTKVIPEEC